MLYKAKNISKKFRDLEIIKNFSLELNQGEFVALLGKRGMGMTCLMQVLTGMIGKSGGEIYYKDKKAFKLYLNFLRRKKLSYLPSEPVLINEINIIDNIMLGFMHTFGRSKSKRRVAKTILKTMGLKGKGRFSPDELTFNEKQRACLGMAIIKEPDIIFCDCLVDTLEGYEAEQMMALLEYLNRVGYTIVLGTHSKAIAQRCHRYIEISTGKTGAGTMPRKSDDDEPDEDEEDLEEVADEYSEEEDSESDADQGQEESGDEAEEEYESEEEYDSEGEYDSEEEYDPEGEYDSEEEYDSEGEYESEEEQEDEDEEESEDFDGNNDGIYGESGGMSGEGQPDKVGKKLQKSANSREKRESVKNEKPEVKEITDDSKADDFDFDSLVAAAAYAAFEEEDAESADKNGGKTDKPVMTEFNYSKEEASEEVPPKNSKVKEKAEKKAVKKTEEADDSDEGLDDEWQALLNRKNKKDSDGSELPQLDLGDIFKDDKTDK